MNLHDIPYLCTKRQSVHIRNSLVTMGLAALLLGAPPSWAQKPKPKVIAKSIYYSLPSGYQQVGNTQLYYCYNGYRINFIGQFQGQYYGSTYSDRGYGVALKVNDGSATEVDCQYGSTVNGVLFTSHVEAQGELARVCYNLKNTNNDTVRISMGTHADVMIGGNDAAPITRRIDTQGTPYGMTLSDGNGAQLCILFGSGLKGVTSVNDYWFGYYSLNNSPYEMVGNYSQGYHWMEENGSYDSGMGWCWKDRKIAAGDSITFSYLIGVGDVKLEPNSNFVATPDDPDSWNNLYLPHNITLEGEYESPAGLDGKIEYAVEDSEEWQSLTDILSSGSKFSKTLVVNFLPGKATHTIRFRTIDNVGNTTMLAPIVYDDIESHNFAGVRDYTFTGDSIYQEEILSDLPSSHYKIGKYENNVHAGSANFYVEGVFPYSIGRKLIPFKINPAQLQGDIAIKSDTTYYYNERPIYPSWNFTLDGNNLLKENLDYVTSLSDNIYPGEATLKVEGKGDYAGTFQKSFTINKAKLQANLYHVELPDSDITYDGMPHVANVTSQEGVGDIILTYYKDGNDTPTATLPTEEGKYDIYLEIAEGKYYQGKPKEKIGWFSIYQMDETEWQLLNALNVTLAKMGRKDAWDMSKGPKGASSLSGVTIKNGHVKELNLSHQQLKGEFAMTTFALPELEKLDISHNQLTGNLGMIVQVMPQLKTLDASYNGFSDLFPMIPASIKTLDISNQTIDRTIALDGSNYDINDIIPQIPTIFAYDHQHQTYTTDLAFLITQSKATSWYEKWGIHVIYKDGKLSVPYVTTPFEYYGESGDTLTAVKLNNDWSNSIEGSNFKVKYSFSQGDANFKPGVDATDIQATVLYAFGEYQYKPFNFTAADTYKDGIINVQDVISTVNIILDEPVSESKAHNSSVARSMTSMDKQDAKASIYLRNGKIFLKTETPIAALSIKATGHINWALDQLGMNQACSEGNLVGYSLSRATLPIGENVIGTYTGNASVQSINLSDEDAQDIPARLGDGTATGIEDVTYGESSQREIYNIQGMKTNTVKQGINIVKSQGNIRKVINK